jgi:beta-glucuronidase
MNFHSPRRFLPDTQAWHNRKGLISDQGQRKKAFFVLQNFLPGDDPHRQGLT